MQEPKACPGFVATAHRVVMEATGQWPNTPPPSERSEETASEDSTPRRNDG